ncbi:MAG: hypothetical protein IMW90_10140 [Thermogemmatispora sp.]|jgi:hypothetical protein|nr:MULTISPECIES: hypothetical protein [Thermogemmatispora]MBE3566075.1 hypothetical protein [Thermogemmatispora sp.]
MQQLITVAMPDKLGWALLLALFWLIGSTDTFTLLFFARQLVIYQGGY